MLKNSMNWDIDPCDNFYQFACGNSVYPSEIPPEATRSTISTIYSVLKKIYEQLDNSLAEKITDSDTMTFKKLKTYFKMCKDEGKHIQSVLIKSSKSDCLNALMFFFLNRIIQRTRIYENFESFWWLAPNRGIFMEWIELRLLPDNSSTEKIRLCHWNHENHIYSVSR